MERDHRIPPGLIRRGQILDEPRHLDSLIVRDVRAPDQEIRQLRSLLTQVRELEETREAAWEQDKQQRQAIRRRVNAEWRARAGGRRDDSWV